MRVPHRLGVILCGCLAAAIAGCGRAPFPVAPVHGRVTIDGQPLASGKVLFAPIAQDDRLEAGKWAMGTVQPDGTFVLSTYGENDGAIVGDHWATVVSSPGGTAATTPKFNRVRIPRRISVVAGQDNEVSISLTAAELRRFDRRAN